MNVSNKKYLKSHITYRLVLACFLKETKLNHSMATAD